MDFNPRSRKGSDGKNTQFSISLGIPALVQITKKILITITYKLLHAFFLPYFRCEPICKSMYACSSHFIS